MNGYSTSNCITRRTALKTGLAAFSVITSAKHVSAKPESGQGKPNILMIMTDQHRGDALHCDGNSVIQTPNLDRIANEGVHFRNAYSSTPTCTPARSALLSGLSPWHHGMLGYGRVADRYDPEKPRAMRNAGYYTLAIGKNHYNPQRHHHGYHQVILDESGRVESFDFKSDYRCWFASEAPNLNPDKTGIGWNDYQAKAYVLPEELHPTSWTGSTAVHFLETYKRKEPFFLKVSFARPHSPYDPPQRFMDLYKDEDLPEAYVGEWAERHAMRGKDLPSNTWRGDLGEEQVRRSRQGYYGNVTFIDEQIGRMLEVLEKRDMLDNTLILFLSDHGDMLGDHHLWRKSYAYEASARVPMVMRWPSGLISAERGQTRVEPVELRDVLPTFLDAAGDPKDYDLDGASLLSLVSDKETEWREYIDLEHDVCYSDENHWNALTDGRYKYIYHAKDGEEQLFNLQNSRSEERDLAMNPAHSQELRKWRNRMVEHLSERGEEFVKNGELALRPQRQLYSPHYPKKEDS